MTKDDFAGKLAFGLEKHPGAAAHAAPATKEEVASKLADVIEGEFVAKGTPAAAIDWGHWLAIIMALLQTLGPILATPAAVEKKGKKKGK